VSTLPPLGDAYLQYLSFEKRLSKLTIKNTARDLADLAAFASGTRQATTARGKLPAAIAINDLSSNDIRRFIATRHAEGMTPKALARMLSGWRGYFKYRLQQNAGHLNPCDGVRAPKAPKRLPQALSPDQAIALVSFKDDSTAGIRDRAAFELLYSCGLRIAELTGMNLDSIDFQSQEVRVLGKGNKTRIVPVGRAALDAVKRWLDVRAQFLHAKNQHEAALLLGERGNRIHASVLEKHIKHWAKVQGLEIDVHPHMLRHSFASHVLQSSQNLRAVQEMMGHASIASTQVYTHLDFQHLAKVYDAAHPRARTRTTTDKKK
jgi:integrase/recombinase XerC